MSEEEVKTVEEKEVEEEKEEKRKEDLVGILKAYSGKPTDEQIEAWKAQHGEVFVSGFSEEELFIWRAITRPEWVELQTATSNPETQIDQFKFEEMVCDTCIIWKSITKSWNEGKAGTPSSLHEQILQHSNFLSPQAASMLVAKL